MATTAGYFDRISRLDALASGDLPAMMPLMRRLFPICRSLTGEGVRRTLDLLGERAPLERRRVPTGTRCFDWDVPLEWNIRDAFVKNSRGEKIIDFAAHNLHVVGYSVPVRARLSLADLQPHLHSRPDMPDAIPYRASYYQREWGFCLTHRQRKGLPEDSYEVVIDSTLSPGHLDYAEARLPGQDPREVFFSTYICHPSMANNELSGPVLLVTLLGLLGRLSPLRHTYRALLAPETIGALAFLSEHLRELQAKMAAGYVVTCVGDDGPYTYKRSRRGTTLADRAAEHVLRHLAGGRPVTVQEFDPVEGSDDRQYGSPGVNLPVGSLMRSPYGEYPEYHTSKDDLAFVSEQALADSLRVYLRVVETIEMNSHPIRTNPCGEPQLGRRGLHPTMTRVGPYADDTPAILTLLAFADGEHDLIDIAGRLGCPVWELRAPLQKLVEADLIYLRA